MGTRRGELAHLWDDVISSWLAGEDPMPDPPPAMVWSDTGRGHGEVTRDAFAEPYVGDLRGTPRMVRLGLNPGRAEPDFQARQGIFAREIRCHGSCSAWAATWPCLSARWERVKGRNRYTRSRLRTARLDQE
jgi:hypothetical protein